MEGEEEGTWGWRERKGFGGVDEGDGMHVRDRNIRKGMYVWVKVNSGEEEGPRGRWQV